MLQLFATKNGWEFKPDDLFPSIVQEHLPFGIFIIFIIGLISALFPSVDGAITALTSSFCIDILGFERRSDMEETQKNKLRKGVHLSFAVLFMLLVFYFKWMDNKSIVDLIFTIAGFTYGPLLGLFAFGILTKRSLKNYMVPIVCLLAPLICLGITYGPLIMTYFDPKYKVENWLNGYAFGHEMLILNGGLTFILLYLTSTATTEKATA
jgi:Na+/proline symporter